MHLHTRACMLVACPVTVPSACSGGGMLPMDPVYGNGAAAAISKRSSPDDAAKPASKRKKVAVL